MATTTLTTTIENLDTLLARDQTRVKHAHREVFTSLDHAELVLGQLFPVTEHWFIYRGGNHVALHRQSGDARVLFITERAATTTRRAKPQPTAEQVAALVTFAAHEGRTWKQALNDCWTTGYYPVFTQRADIDGLLQQVRNTFGPSWLKRFTPPTHSDECPQCSRIGAGPFCKAHAAEADGHGTTCALALRGAACDCGYTEKGGR